MRDGRPSHDEEPPACSRGPGIARSLLAPTAAATLHCQFGGINTYCLNRSVSACPTYLPISLSNCVQVFHGRYSMNSADMREPTPGISMNSSRVPVLRLIGTKALR